MNSSKIRAPNAIQAGLKANFYSCIFGASVWLLAGCSALPDKPQRPVVYDLGHPRVQAVWAAPAAAPAAAAQRPTLKLTVEAVPQRDALAMGYRLLYQQPQQVWPYALAQWRASPAELLRQALAQTLAAQVLLVQGDEAVTPLGSRLLRVEVQAFEQQFESPERSQAVLTLLATVGTLGARGETLWDTRLFSLRLPAPSADAAGGAWALAQAVQQVLPALADWALKAGGG